MRIGCMNDKKENGRRGSRGKVITYQRKIIQQTYPRRKTIRAFYKIFKRNTRFYVCREYYIKLSLY